jgi:nitronate monooxygenase/enoyl-[acyl-carrier protein] reductase II
LPRFPIEEAWKTSIVSAQSENAVKLEVLNDIQPLPGTAGYGTILRSLRTSFMDEWAGKREGARREGVKLWDEIQARARAGRRSETLLTAGQTVGGVKGILPIAEIIRQLVAEAEHALSQASMIVHC